MRPSKKTGSELKQIAAMLPRWRGCRFGSAPQQNADQFLAEDAMFLKEINEVGRAEVPEVRGLTVGKHDAHKIARFFTWTETGLDGWSSVIWLAQA